MANVTDPLIKSVQGSDPQNLMEYITRQKIYDSRFWKEECFGLTAADVMERAAESLTCVGGTYSGIGKPSKFLCLTLKLLQLQPDKEVVETFLEQDTFKYLQVLGAFYLRLTGRPQDIYELLDPLYGDYSKLKYRDVNEWKLMHVDEFVHDLLTQDICCGIAMPRLPKRETLQEAGYLEDGPRASLLQDKLMDAGGIKEYLKLKVDEELRKQMGQPAPSNDVSISSAIALWEKRYGKVKKAKKEVDATTSNDSERAASADVRGQALSKERAESSLTTEDNNTRKRKHDDSTISIDKKKKEKKQSKKYGTLFKASAVEKDNRPREAETNDDKPVDQNSDEYWNSLRSSLGLNPLKK